MSDVAPDLRAIKMDLVYQSIGNSLRLTDCVAQCCHTQHPASRGQDLLAFALCRRMKHLGIGIGIDNG